MRDGDSGIRLAEMTSPEVHSELARGRTTIVVPFGAVEQPGPHLPLDTDAVMGDGLGHLLAQRLDALCAPTVRIGCSQHASRFPGTLSIRPGTPRMLVADVVDSLSSHGFRRIILLAAHGGNEGPLARRRTRGRLPEQRGWSRGGTRALADARAGARARHRDGGRARLYRPAR